MEKWADYCISKASFNNQERRYTSFYVKADKGDTLGDGAERERNWVVQKLKAGYSFCTVTRLTKSGKWKKVSDVNFKNGAIQLNAKLPDLLTKRKTFLSYYHNDDQAHKVGFENRFGDLIVNKSVGDGDIDSDVQDEYIKQLIQKGYLSDTTVLIVLVGKNTKDRKHVDWEISGALDLKVGDHYVGLIGILLPDHPDYGKDTYKASNLPKRLAANVESGYAELLDWTTDRIKMQKRIEDAFSARKTKTHKRVNRAVKQKQRNTGS